MPEPLTEEQLRECRLAAEFLGNLQARGDSLAAITRARGAIRALLAEVARLKAREADLVADNEMRNITAQLVLDDQLVIEEEEDL